LAKNTVCKESHREVDCDSYLCIGVFGTKKCKKSEAKKAEFWNIPGNKNLLIFLNLIMKILNSILVLN
jgi:hypothetical protein